jgi:carbon monoxide dehydrogenase subunit G
MRLTHEAAAPGGVAALWRALLDPVEVAAALPRATVTVVDGPVGHGEATVRLGTLRLRYAGSVRIRLRDDAEHRLVLSVAATDPDGGGLRGEVTLALSGDDRSAVCSALADLDLTGAPVRFGRTAVLADLAGLIDTLIDTLVAGLSAGLAGHTPAPEPAAPAQPGPERTLLPTGSPARRGPATSGQAAALAAGAVAGVAALAWIATRVVRGRPSGR